MAFLNTDVPELLGSDTATVLDNLDILGARRGRLTESMLAMLSELADAILHDAGGDPDTVDSILLSLIGTVDDLTETENTSTAAINARIREQVIPENRELMGRVSVHAGLHMRLVLYRLLEERTLQSAPAVKAPDPLPDAACGRIAYMAGALADEAYERLSPLVPHARSATFHSFVDACEEVRGGLCEFAILPLESNHSGKLTAFSRLIIRYGLYIVAITDLENAAAPGQVTRFALLCKAPDSQALLFSASGGHTGTSLYLELLHTESTPSVTELLSAAAFCGLTPIRIDTLPLDETELLGRGDGHTLSDTLPLCCVLDATAADLATFRRFLTLEASEDILMGLYRPQ